MKTKDIANIIEEMAPLSLMEEWDNSGFQLDLKSEINRILVAMEINDDVINEAESLGAQMIVAHHPMFFIENNEVVGNSYYVNYIERLKKSGISVYSSHTAFDLANGGNNDYLAEAFRLSEIKKLDGDDLGYLRMGEVKETSIKDFAEEISRTLKVDKKYFRYSGNLNANIKKIALLTGAGADPEWMDIVKENGCDLYVTGDLKHHSAMHAKEIGLNVLDITHWGSEKIFTDNMAKYLRTKLDIEVIESKIDLNPFDLI